MPPNSSKPSRTFSLTGYAPVAIAISPHGRTFVAYCLNTCVIAAYDKQSSIPAYKLTDFSSTSVLQSLTFDLRGNLFVSVADVSNNKSHVLRFVDGRGPGLDLQLVLNWFEAGVAVDSNENILTLQPTYGGSRISIYSAGKTQPSRTIVIAGESRNLAFDSTYTHLAVGVIHRFGPSYVKVFDYPKFDNAIDYETGGVGPTGVAVSPPAF